MKRFLIAAFVLVGLAGWSEANPLRRIAQRIQSRHAVCQQKAVTCQKVTTRCTQRVETVCQQKAVTCQTPAVKVFLTVVDEPPVVENKAVATAQVEATAKKPGKVFCIALRAKLRQEFRAKGHGVIESIRMANAASDDVIAGLIADAETMSGVKVVGTAIGDGKIIDAILDFFKSPQGQDLIAALIKLLLGMFIQHTEPIDMWYSSLSAWNV